MKTLANWYIYLRMCRIHTDHGWMTTISQLTVSSPALSDCWILPLYHSLAHTAVTYNLPTSTQ